MERVRDVVITVLGVLGVATVVWLVAAWALGLSVIVFVTGSMSPAMPTGSAAIVQRVAAADLAVGDVVTVPRHESGTPVTHRIVEIDRVGAGDDRRELTLRGDANDFPDSETYVVAEARRVVVVAPELGSVVLHLRSPVIMAVAGVALAVAITWALWPSRRARPEGEDTASSPHPN